MRKKSVVVEQANELLGPVVEDQPKKKVAKKKAAKKKS